MKKAIIAQPAHLVRAFWDLQASLDEPAAFEQALHLLLRHIHDGLSLTEEPIIIHLGGRAGERCDPCTLFAGYKGGSWKMVGLDGLKSDWVMHNHALLAETSQPFRRGFWNDSRRGATLLVYYLGLGTSPIWQHALNLPRESPIKWAFLALVQDDPRWPFGDTQENRLGAHVSKILNMNLPERLLGVAPDESWPNLARKRCGAILEHARELPAIPTQRQVRWDQLTPLPGEAVSRRLAYFFTLDPEGPHQTWEEAGKIIGLDPRSVRRGAKHYEERLTRGR